MTRDQHDQDQSEGGDASATRRQVLRAAAVGGAVVWTAPAVQVLTMSSASAQAASPPGGGGCTPTGSTRGRADNVIIRVGGASNAGTSAASAQEGLGGPDTGEVGSATPSLPPVSTRTDAARSVSEVTAVLATTTADSAVEELVVDLPATVPTPLGLQIPIGDLVVRTITSTATATATAAGGTSATSGSTVLSVLLAGVPIVVPAGATEVLLPPAGAPLAGFIRLTFNQETVVPGVRQVEITRTALRVQVPSLGIDVVAGRTNALASYPACS